MKRTLSFALALVFCLFVLASCAQQPAEETPSEQVGEPQGEQIPVPDPQPEPVPETELVWLCVKETQYYSGSGIEWYHKDLEYDDRGNLMFVSNGQVFTVQLPHSEEMLQAIRRETYTYDEEDRVLTHSNETVSAAGEKVLSASREAYEYEGDLCVKKTSSVEYLDEYSDMPDERYYTLYTYDAEGRLVKEEYWRDWEGNDELYSTATFDYSDPAGVLWTQESVVFYPLEEKFYTPSVEQPTSVAVKQYKADKITLTLDAVDTYSYDENGNVLESVEHAIYMDVGESGTKLGAHRKVYTYDEEGRVLEVKETFVDEEGAETPRSTKVHRYDANGNLFSVLSKDHNGADTGWVQYEYVQKEVPVK